MFHEYYTKTKRSERRVTSIRKYIKYWKCRMSHRLHSPPEGQVISAILTAATSQLSCTARPWLNFVSLVLFYSKLIMATANGVYRALLPIPRMLSDPARPDFIYIHFFVYIFIFLFIYIFKYPSILAAIADLCCLICIYIAVKNSCLSTLRRSCKNHPRSDGKSAENRSRKSSKTFITWPRS
jgi:hypothetical protein